MFVAHCPRHGSNVLLTERRIRKLYNTERGIFVVLECYDGEMLTVLTGRAATSAPAASTA